MGMMQDSNETDAPRSTTGPRGWPQPFCAVIWPGTSPHVDLRRDGPELILVAAAIAVFVVVSAGARAGQAVLAAGAAQYEAVLAAALNPVFGLPVALLGATTGVRLALLLSWLAAGLGMWWLCRVLGLGRIGRVWAGLAYAFAGYGVAELAAGRLGAALAFAWLPWALGYALAASRTRRPGHVAGAAAALALALLSGGPGLAVTAVIVAVLLLLIGALGSGRPVTLASREGRMWLVVLGLLLACGLAAVQLLPALAAGRAGLLAAGPTTVSVPGVFLDRAVQSQMVGPAYAYLGWPVLLFLAGLPLAVLAGRRDRRDLLFLGVLALLATAWAGSGVWRDAGAPSLMLGWATAALVALAGTGLDALWTWTLAHQALQRVSVPGVLRWAAARLGLVMLVGLLLFSVVDLYRTNRPMLQAGVTGVMAQAALQWLRISDVTGFYQAAYPILFKAGVVMSSLSLIGLLGLLVGDVRRRRRRLETDAVYSGGALQPVEPLPLPDGTAVHVTVEAEDEAEAKAEAETGVETEVKAKDKVAAGTDLTSTLTSISTLRLEWVLFGLALLVYVITRLWAMDRFPIYFFADEATHAVYAQDLLDHGLRDGKGAFLPIYFEAAGNRWTPLLSVYVHAVSVALFGKSLLVTRATSAMVSILAALAVALILKLVFRARYWWAGALIMAVAPAWFLHSRTGFETVMMSSFFACFLLCYLLYRTRAPRFLFAAILFGAATFYTYSNGQMIMAAAGVLLALSDFRFHIKNWRTVLLGLLLIAVLAVPVLRFRASQPESMTTHLRAIDSYLFHTMPASAKVEQFVKTYTYGLSPAYWFMPNAQDLVRHRMKGYGNLPLPLLPFFLIGAGLCLWRVKSAPHRAVLLAALATPVGAALVDVSITRVLAFVAPASVLIGLGLEAALGFVKRRVSYGLAAGILFAVLAGAAGWMLRDALTNGPLWYSDYGLYGMQYGAKQLFVEAVPEDLRKDPNTRIMMTSTWANGADTFIRFFLPREQAARVQMLNIDYYLMARRDLNSDIVLVMTPSEYQRAQASGKFKSVDVEQVVPYPDGSPGFYFARLAYADNFDEVLAQERAVRSQPVMAQAVIDGESVQVLHSQLDMGLAPNLFDGDTFTLVRGLEANPLVFEFTFPQPRRITGLGADFASMDFALTVKLYADPAGEPSVYTETYRGLPPDPHVEMVFDGAPEQVTKMRLEILQLNPGNEVHIHVRELKFK